MSKRTCFVAECDAPAHTKGLCRRHLRKMRLFGDPLVPDQPPGRPARFCPIDGCGRPARAHGLCGTHDYRRRTFGDAHHEYPTAAERYHAGYTTASADQCWEWTKGVTQDGYGKFTVEGETVVASRYGWALLHGPIADGLCVCHTCDNPPCQNPAHWFLGTNADNTRDKMAKGRHKANPYRAHGRFTGPP